ncbi:MAG: hypothetical protein ACR2IE_00100 [Candidatus Sumerlaeaceae bacterium]
MVIYPALLVFAIAVCSFRPVLDPDCWFHMALGRLLNETHRLTRVDVFSSTAAGNEWISSGWLPSLLLHVSYTRWQFAGLAACVFVTMALTYLAVYYHGVVRLRNRGSLVIILLTSVLAANMRFTPRPEIFSLLFLALMLVCLLAIDAALESVPARVPRVAFAVPLLIMAWANCHAGFVIGLLVLFIYCGTLGWRWRHLRSKPMLHCAALLATGFLTWLINPYGWNAMKLAGKIQAMPGVQQHVMEWMPLFATTGPALPTASLVGLGLLVGLAVLILVLHGGRVQTWHAIAIALFVVLACWQRRHHGLSAIALPILLMPYMAALDRVLMRIPGLVQTLAASGAVAIALLQHSGALQVGRGLFHLAPDNDLLPSLAVRWINAHRPPENLYNAYGAGGYLLYNSGPQTKVFIDGRLDVYDPATWRDSLGFESGDIAISDFAKRYSIQSALVYIRGMGTNPAHIARRLDSEPGWQLVYFDDSYALYVRETAETSRYLRENAFRFVNPFDLGRITSPEAVVAAGTVRAEIQRALKTSDNSVKAMLVAAYEARHRGDEATAQKYIEAARVKNPAISFGSR